MTGPEVLDVARDALVTLVLVASPLMLVGLGVGVAISLFQALTQIQEMTLVFVPKILAIFVAMLLALPFMADALQSHMARIAARVMTLGTVEEIERFLFESFARPGDRKEKEVGTQ